MVRPSRVTIRSETVDRHHAFGRLQERALDRCRLTEHADVAQVRRGERALSLNTVAARATAFGLEDGPAARDVAHFERRAGEVEAGTDVGDDPVELLAGSSLNGGMPAVALPL